MIPGLRDEKSIKRHLGQQKEYRRNERELHLRLASALQLAGRSYDAAERYHQLAEEGEEEDGEGEDVLDHGSMVRAAWAAQASQLMQQ